MQAWQPDDYDDIYTDVSERYRAAWKHDPFSEETARWLSLLEIIADAMSE